MINLNANILNEKKKKKKKKKNRAFSYGDKIGYSVFVFPDFVENGERISFALGNS